MYPIYKRNINEFRMGYSLIELILTIGLLTILLGVVTFTFVIGLRVADVGMSAGGARRETSNSLRTISEELRQATAITSADQHSLTFQSDSDRNGAIETITYLWSGTEGDSLIRIQGTDTKILAGGVSNALFQYYDSNSVVLGPPFPVAASAVKLVELTLQAGKEAESVQYRVKIRPRGI